jgi:N utilization substance protein A
VANDEDPDAVPGDDLLAMPMMEEALAYRLARRGIISLADLADQSVDELLELDGMDPEHAASLIMAAREPMFAGSEND